MRIFIHRAPPPDHGNTRTSYVGYRSLCRRLVTDGRSRSTRVRGGVFNTNSAGVCPVELCGVTRYRVKTLHRRSSRLPVVFFNPAFAVCTALSANPLLDGRYDEHLTCFMPFALQNCSNSSLVKQLSLSESMVIGSLSMANVYHSFVIVALVVADDTTCAPM